MSSVNAPTNTKVKEQDINSKLQLYGIYEAFAKGKVPSNKQIDVAMNSAMASKPLAQPSNKLSTEGQQLVGDLKDVIEQAKVLLLTKNNGNLLQDFIWQTQGIGAGDAQKPGAPVDKDTARQHGLQAKEGLRTLGQLVITNGQFRKLLKDGVTLLRDIGGDAAANSANRMKPSEQELNDIDRPAEDNTWHEAPDLSKDNFRNQAKNRMPIGKKDVKEAAGDATQQAHPSGTRDPAQAADQAAQDQQQGTQGGTPSKANAQQGAQQGAQKLKDRATANMSEEQKEKLRQNREKAHNYFLNEKMPKERREQVIWRVKKMIVEIQGHQDYHQAIDTILRLAEEYDGHTRNVVQQGQGSMKGAHSQDTLKTAETNLKTLLERFANNTSFDDLTDSINKMYKHADEDPELKNFFRDLNGYIRKCLKEQGFVLQESSNEEWNRLYDQGEFLLRDRYRSDVDRIIDEFKFLGDQFDQDPQNKSFANSMNKLFNDLGHDENGKSAFKPHLVKDLTEVILPAVFENIRYVPIPRIEYSDPMADVVVENLVIEGDNLAPNVFEFGSDNYWRWGRKSIQNKNKNKVMLSVSGIQCDLRDVAYYIKKKEGFPSITDKGVMDIFLGGSGLSFKVAMETADKHEQTHFFKINTVTVDIKNMDIKLKESNHKLLFNLFKPLLFKVMRPVIQKVVEKQVRENVQKLDAQLYAVKQEADRAEAEAKRNPDPEHMQNMYQRYFNAFQRQMTKGQQKKEEAKEKTADKKVNVALTQHESILPNIKLPGGISNKATEYRDLAAKGEQWESPVFGIGSAGESSNLPSAPEVTRKPHNVSQGGVRDPSQSNRQYKAAGNSAGSNIGGNYGANSDSANYGADSTNSGMGGQYSSSGQFGSSVPAGSNQGFASQVNDAFSDQGTQGLAGGLNQSGSGAPPSEDPYGNTTLGRNNPVFDGKA
ncbi:hypothetical protein MBLNU230_g4540t1 [Neophaeotheca triangularis]